MFCVLVTDSFVQSAKDLGLDEDEVHRIIETLSNNPLIGDIIPRTGGARKWRAGTGQKGKSGGYRIVSYYAGDDIPVFLLEIFAKSEKINLSQRERNELKAILGGIADEYRKSVTRNVARLTETGR